MGHTRTVGENLVEAPEGCVHRSSPIVVHHLADQMHFTTGQEGIMCLADHVTDNFPVVLRQVTGHDSDIAVSWEVIAGEVTGLRDHSFGHPIPFNKLPGDHNDRWQVQHYCPEPGIILSCNDGIGTGTSAQIHHPGTMGEVNVFHKSSARTETDAGGSLVIASGRIHGHGFIAADNSSRLLIFEFFGQSAPAVPARAGKSEPGSRVALFSLDQETLNISGILKVVCSPVDEIRRSTHRHQPISIHLGKTCPLCKTWNSIVTLCNGGKEFKVDCGKERR